MESWTPETLRPYLDVVVEAFGVERLMAGSDWPVCLVASEYGRWFDVLRSILRGSARGSGSWSLVRRRLRFMG